MHTVIYSKSIVKDGESLSGQMIHYCTTGMAEDGESLAGQIIHYCNSGMAEDGESLAGQNDPLLYLWYGRGWRKSSRSNDPLCIVPLVWQRMEKV